MDRSISADLIKSISIFGVVFIHGASLFGYASYLSEMLCSLFRFCVPCFVIIFAYFYETSYAKKTNQEQKAYTYSRLKHLFIVYFVWSTIYFLILVNWHTITFQKLITTHFAGYGFAGQYFFILLFQIIILYPLFRWMYTKKPIRYLTIIGVFLIYFAYGHFYKLLPDILWKLGDAPFLSWIPYIFTGIALSRNEIKKISLIYSLILILILIDNYTLNFRELGLFANIRPLVILSSIVFCIAILQNCVEIKNDKLNSIIKYIGKNTMTIFITNPLVIIVFSKIISNNSTPNPTIFQIIVTPFLSTIFVFSVCILLTEIINRSKLKGILN